MEGEDKLFFAPLSSSSCRILQLGTGSDGEVIDAWKIYNETAFFVLGFSFLKKTKTKNCPDRKFGMEKKKRRKGKRLMKWLVMTTTFRF